jgi:hypothetical protein
MVYLYLFGSTLLTGSQRTRSQAHYAPNGKYLRALATRCHLDERQRCVRMALLRCVGSTAMAHRLLTGKTAAKSKKHGRLVSQAAKLIEDRQLQLSKALAPFVLTGAF